MSELDRYTVPVTADQFQAACFEDRFPVTYADCERIAKVTEECCSDGGFFTIGTMVRGMGYVLTAYDRLEKIMANIVINLPVEAENRKIPQLSWLRHKFKLIGHDFKSNNIRQMYKIIENHIRDGGTWEYTETKDSIHFELKANGFIKGKHSFYREDLFI